MKDLLSQMISITQRWQGIRDKDPVFVKLFMKYPWREESANFFRQLNIQARALRKARVPEVIGLISIYDHPEYSCMVFEWFENEGTLEDAILTLRGLSTSDAVMFIKRVAQVVHQLHENPGRQPIIIRELRPTDILLKQWKGSIDWQQVRFVIKGFDRAVIQGRSSVGYEGKSPYAAPELDILDQKEIRQSKTLDVYALGSLLKFLLIGKHPAKDEAFSLDSIPDILLDVINCSTAIKPVARYPSISEMLSHLSLV